MNVLDDIDDDRLRTIVREELDRRERETQSACYHRRSGTMDINLTVKCDECNKILGDDDRAVAYDYETPISTPERIKINK